MKLPRASMTTTLFVILVFAVEFGVARDLLIHDRGTRSVLGLGFLPMLTVLVFGLYRIARLGARCDAFTVGFAVAGLVASGSYLGALQFVPAFWEVLTRLALALDDNLLALDDRVLALLPEAWGFEDVLDLDVLLVAGVMLSTPPLLAAIAGGWLGRKLVRGADGPRKRSAIRPRFTLGTVSVLVAVLAVDFALIRQAVVGPSFWTTFGIGFLPVMNALALGLPRTLRNRAARFTFGFEVAGWISVGIYLAACVIDPGAMMERLGACDRAVLAALDLAFGSGRARQLYASSIFSGLIFDLGVVAAFFSLPPLVAALSGGTITRRFGRRPARAA